MIRKLASIKKIETLLPHPNADKLDIAHIGGWQVVVKKSEFNEGDLVVYCEIDSHIPLELAPFLEKGNKVRTINGVDGVVLKTIRLRGELSQGLILPLSVLSTDVIPAEGLDVSEDLNIAKWEPPQPASLSGQTKGNFPSFIQKTDQERIQNLPKYFTENWYKDVDWEISIKLDGSSMTVYHNEGEFGVCSRNLELREDDTNTFWKVSNRLELKDTLANYGKNIALQGELIGEGIQGNHEGIQGQDFYVYDIFLIDEQRYSLPDERMEILKGIAHKDLNHVPIMYEYVRLGDFKKIQEFLIWCEKLDNGESLYAPNREGLVFKSHELHPYKKQPVSFKAISNNYLL